MPTRGRLFIWFIGLAFTISGCANLGNGVAPDNSKHGSIMDTNRTQVMIPAITPSSESMLEQSLVAYSDVKKKLRPSDDKKQSARVVRIFTRISKQAAAMYPVAKEWQWEVNLLKNDEVNAFCMPGGKIVVYTGLLDRLRLSDDELAFILGHEAAHAVKEHSREQMGQVNMLGGLIAGINQFYKVPGYANTALQTGGKAVIMGYSRTQEHEADAIGMEISSRAGYNPRAAISSFEKMKKLFGGGSKSFFASHPTTDERLEELQKLIALADPLYRQALLETKLQNKPKSSKQ